jgi:uncharacterized membrane protein YcfT
LASRIDRPWRQYLDSKVVHFAYFYVLWMTIQFAVKGPGIYLEQGLMGLVDGWLTGFIEPFGTLWFIYLLAVFFIVAKALRRVPPVLLLAAGAVLEAAPIETGWLLVDEFAARFVYFFAGYWLARHIFAFAAAVDRQTKPALLAGLVIWAWGNAILVDAGWSQLLGISLAMGFAGAAAVVVMGVLVSRLSLGHPVRYCGANSIVIYIAFFLFMAAGRSILVKTGLIDDLGLVALLVTAAGVAGPVLLFWSVRNTPLAFIFARPHWARPWQQPVMKFSPT